MIVGYIMDDFTEFQMAVGQHTPASSRENGNAGGKALWVLDHSPVHAVPFNHNYQTQKSESRNLTVQPFASVKINASPSPSSVHPEKNSVGSRLANYNLGMKGSASGTGSQVLNTVPIMPHVKENPSKFGTNYNPLNQSLMGEEDKYAALRVLVDFNTDSSQMSSFGPSKSSETWEIKPIPFNACEKPTSTLAMQPEQSQPWSEDDFATDFGDFQSFTEPQQTFGQQSTEVFSSFGTSPSVDLSERSSSKESETLRFGSKNNGTNNDRRKDKVDMEFGDFVSVEPSFQSYNFVSSKDQVAKSSNLANDVPSNFTLSSAKDKSLEPLEMFSMPSYEISKPSMNEDAARTNYGFPTTNTQFSINDLIGSGVEMFSRPNFIKTSLIGYSTSTSDNNDATKCASPIESNNESLDFFSLGQKESLNSLEKNRFLDISPETRSIASLDLGNYYTIPDCNENGKSSAEQFVLQNDSDDACTDLNVSSIVPVSRRESSDMRASEIAFNSISDKYKCFKEEIENEKERYNLEWVRCLECCKEVISRTINIFNEAPNSGVVREVVSDERGGSFIQNLLEVYFISTRIYDSWNKVDGNCNSGTVGILYRDIQDLWESLAPFFIGTAAMDIITLEQDRKEKSEINGMKFCGVCMNNADEEFYDVIDYGGTFYHSNCANFWINAVDTILPSLSHIPLSRNPKP